MLLKEPLTAEETERVSLWRRSGQSRVGEVRS